MKASYTWVVPSLKTYKRNIYQRKEINYLSMITENLSTLKIHKLTQAQYDRELEAGNIDPNALYLTPDEEIDIEVDTTLSQSGKAADAKIVGEAIGKLPTFDDVKRLIDEAIAKIPIYNGEVEDV